MPKGKKPLTRVNCRKAVKVLRDALKDAAAGGYDRELYRLMAGVFRGPDSECAVTKEVSTTPLRQAFIGQEQAVELGLLGRKDYPRRPTWNRRKFRIGDYIIDHFVNKAQLAADILNAAELGES